MLAITTLAVVAPFVMSVIGLVGSVGWFPLTIAFPILCWIKVRARGRDAVGVVFELCGRGTLMGWGTREEVGKDAAQLRAADDDATGCKAWARLDGSRALAGAGAEKA